MIRTSILLIALLVPCGALAQDFDAVEITRTEVAPGLHMLMGRGGNIAVSTGEDGILLIDDQYAPLTEKILAAVASLQAGPVRFVVNTHWHGDHTGGNENLGKAGALIVAHDEVRSRMSVEQFMEAFGRKVPASPPDALPVVTFSESLTLHWNGDRIHILHAPPAHTDGDSIVHFTEANVVHMGDTYFNGFYPFIDVGSGGSIDGVILAASRVLETADDATKIIPGHGPLSNRAELTAYRDMLSTVRSRIADAIAEGKDADATIAAKPTADLDAEWGDGFMKPDTFVGIVHSSVTRQGR